MNANLPKSLRGLDRPNRREMTNTEQIVASYTHGHKLSDKLEEYRRLLELANSLRQDGNTRRDVIEILIDVHGIEKTKAYQAVRDSVEVFGDINKYNQEGLRYIQTEWYEKMAKKLEDTHPELAILCRQRIDKINGLEDRKSGTINIKKILQPKAIIFTTDPAALDMQRQIEEAEDADYEEMEE